jgi:hypothetical protein
MSRMTPAEIAAVAKGAGFSGQSLQIAVAVALAESGGNPRAHNRVPPDDSYGLWQINMLGSLGPARRKQFGLSSNSQLFDPSTNARAAWAISNRGTNWRPWSVYLFGQYRLQMARAAEGVKAAGGAVVTTPESGAGTTPISGDRGTHRIDFGKGDGATQINLTLGAELGRLFGKWLGMGAPGGEMLEGVPVLGPVIAGLGTIVDLLMVWTTALIKSAVWISKPENWMRIAQVVLGGALVVSGGMAIARPYAQPVISQAGAIGKTVVSKGAA